MPAYIGTKQLFKNHFGGKPLREIYHGTKKIMGFEDGRYNADDFVTRAINKVEKPPTINAGDHIVNVSTTGYATGYAYSKHYCDHLEYSMMYAGDCYFYDAQGNEIISIKCTEDWSFASGKWTLTCKVVMFGKTLLDESKSSNNIDGSRLSIKIYYDFSSKKWVFERAGAVLTSDVVEWQPTYFCLMPYMWMMISMYDSMFFDGFISIVNMNRAVGYPQAIS